MLILFDVDGTLLITRRAGIEAMTAAGRSLFGSAFTMDGVDVAGRLDGLIWADAAARNDVDDHERWHARFREAYAAELDRLLASTHAATLLPGVSRLVNHLGGVDGLTLGLLTGNYPETGRLKLERAGLDPAAFPVQAWGSDGRHRRDLPPLAIRQWVRHAPASGRPDEVVIIGDTPHDVDCARHHGCRCLAVTTGRYDEAELREAGAEAVLPNLDRLDEVIAHLRLPG